jgi:uncharacterized repeat protein (TIGR01451 family)
LDEAFSAAPHDAPTGRTALPIVAAEVLGPDEINVGGVASYTVVVGNLGEVSVDHVQVKVSLPAGVQVAQIHPQPASRQAECLRFDIGRLTPKSRRRIQIELTAHERGVLNVQAEAIFSALAHTATKVCQPELAMTVEGPAVVVVGDAATFKVILENRGDGAAENVAVSQRTSDDPLAVRGAAHVGRLAPGACREIYLSAVTSVAGRFLAQFVATAWGGIQVEAETEVRVACPMLAIEASGPRVCAVNSPEVYTLTLANPGDAPAGNIEAVASIPPGMQVAAFDRPVQFDAVRRIVRWRVSNLPPGSRETLRIKAAAMQPDRFALQVAAAADYGLRAECEHQVEAAGRHAA